MSFKYNVLIDSGFCYFENFFLGVRSSVPTSSINGMTYINSSNNGFYIYYAGTWQLLHTLTPASASYLLQEDGSSFILQEDGASKFVQE